MPGAQHEGQALGLGRGRGPRQRRDRLNEIIAALERDGFAAQGDIGDGDPVQAIEDALRQFPADEVIVSTHPPGRSHWLEREVVERARERFPIPVTHVIVDLERDPAA